MAAFTSRVRRIGPADAVFAITSGRDTDEGSMSGGRRPHWTLAGASHERIVVTLARLSASRINDYLSRFPGDDMKIVVIGGTGLIGSKLVAKLRDSGHDAVAASPNTGVN